jgi:chemotaxis signal transduction protein
VSGYVTFLMGGRVLAGQLGDVREVVRAAGLEPLRGARAPVTALLTVRGTPLPVVDLREEADPGDAGDVLVLAPEAGGAMGVAVDKVLAVLDPDELTPVPAAERRPVGLPAYVVEVRRDATDAAVLVVALRVLAGLSELSGLPGLSGPRQT